MISSISRFTAPSENLRRQAQKLESELPEHRPGELLVGLQPGASFAPTQFDSLGGEVLHRFRFPQASMAPEGEMLHLKLPEGVTTAEAMLALQNDPQVAYATPNHVFDAQECLEGKSVSPNDLDKNLWGMNAIHAPEAWATTHGSKNTVIAVFDSGIDTEHPDLKANLWTNTKEIPGNGKDDDGNGYVDDVHGIDPYQMNGDVADKFRHGTHTAGTIAAVGNNGTGVTGVNWDARILAIKIFDKNGKTDAAAIAKGMEYAARAGARITSHSWGNKVFNPAMLEAFQKSSALHICAAGNKGEDNDRAPIFPASFELDNVVSVANTDRKDVRASRSNYGFQTVDLAAPGTDILSTVPGGKYEVMSGTSMACPHVSGAAGLVASAFPNASSQEIKNRLIYSTDKIDGLKSLVASGGRLNAASALDNDTIAPGAIASLSIKKADARGLNLQWTAPGDDGSQGTAALYDVRISNQPIDEKNFEKAHRIPISPPKSGGSREEVRLDVRPDLKAQEMFVAIKAYDNVGHASGLATINGKVPAAQVAFRDQGASSFQVDGKWTQISSEDGPVWLDTTETKHQNSSLSTKPFSLAGIKNATAIFDAKLGLEGKDNIWLQASTDGSTWSALGRMEGNTPWEPHQIDLSKYDGEKNVQFRFTLNGEGAAGVQLRNIAVVGDPK